MKWHRGAGSRRARALAPAGGDSLTRVGRPAARSRRPGPPAAATARSRAIIALALTVSSLVAACSPAPLAAGAVASPAPSATTIAPVAATRAPSPLPTGDPTPGGSQDELTQRITKAVNAATAGRTGQVNLALHAPAQHVTVEVGSSTPVRGASVIKLLILEARLANGPLTGADKKTAQAMITRSDNDAATTLWTQAGGTPALTAAAKRFGMSRTTTIATMYQPWDGWQTTAMDQARLLDALVSTGRHSPSTTLELMTKVNPDQAWGVGQAAEPGQPVAVKNGWLPLTSNNWIINSVGCLAPTSPSPVCVSITSIGSPSMAYGIHTVTAAARAAIETLNDGAADVAPVKDIGPPKRSPEAAPG